MKKLIVLLAVVSMIFCAVPAMADQSQEQNPEGDGTQSQATAGSTIHDESKSYSNDKRQLPSGPMGGFGIVAPMTENGRITGNVQFVDDILVVRDTYTLRMLTVLNHRDADYKILISAHQSARLANGHPEKGIKGMDLDREITIVKALRMDKTRKLIMPEGTDRAFIRGQADDSDDDTMALMAGMAIEAMRHGADTLVIVGEGAKKVLEATGWGFQLGTTGATISDKDSSAMGAVVGGGFGYGEAEGSYGYRPWLQGWAYSVK